jgi:putative transposase
MGFNIHTLSVTNRSTNLPGHAALAASFNPNLDSSQKQPACLGVMDRLVLSDAAWERMAPLIIGRPDQKGSTGRDNRMFVEGVLWIVRTGSPWRDLPEIFGEWNSVFRRFSRWSRKGVWWRIFEAMSDDPDFEYLIVDSTIVRAHQHAAGAKKGGLKIRPLAARAAA